MQTPDRRSTRAELVSLMSIGAPLMMAYLAEYAMFLITRLVVGDLGYESLAAVGVAGDLTFEMLVVAMGTTSVVGVLVAQAHGRGETPEVGNALTWVDACDAVLHVMGRGDLGTAFG